MHAHICGLYPTVGVYVQPGGMAHWLLEEQLRSARDKEAQSQRAASELEMERRNILSAMRYREPERGGLCPWCSASPFNQSQSAFIMNTDHQHQLISQL